MYPLAHKGMGPVSTFISGGPTWLKRKSGRDPAMVSTWQQDFRIFSGFPPRCLVHDQLSNTKHVHHSFCFLVVAPLVRMSWAYCRRAQNQTSEVSLKPGVLVFKWSARPPAAAGRSLSSLGLYLELDPLSLLWLLSEYLSGDVSLPLLL